MADENEMTDETSTATVTEGEVSAPETTETVETPEAETLDAAALKAELEGAQKRIAELNKENEKRRLAEKAAAEQKLIDEGKSKELAETAQAERDAVIAERDALSEKVNKANELLNADIEKRIKDWPEEAKALLPNIEGVDALERLEQVARIEPLAKKLMDAPPKPGNGSGPTAVGGPSGVNEKALAEAAAEYTRRAF